MATAIGKPIKSKANAAKATVPTLGETLNDKALV
jgi:hypothetical protein